MNLSELPPAVKQRLYEKWEPVLDYDWWDSVYEQYKEDGEERGMSIDDIFFSGFSSQGDGACWKGTFDAEKYLEWEETQDSIVFNDKETLFLKTVLDTGFIFLTAKTEVVAKGNYCNSSTMEVAEFEIDLWSEDGEEVTTGPLAGMGKEEFSNQLEKLLPEINEKITTICRDFADEIYKSLEEAHDYLHSMEAFENDSQDVEFDEEGETV